MTAFGPFIQSKNWLAILLLLFCTYFSQLSSADQVKITNVDDLPLGSFGGVGDKESTDALCIYNDTTTSYTVEVSGPGAGSSFELPRNSGGASIPFDVSFRDSVGGYVILSANVQSAPFTGANTSSANCGGGTNATVRITITEASLKLASQGSYSGSISITIYPV